VATRNTKGLKFFMSGKATAVSVALAAADEISNAKPAVVTVAATTGIAVGDIITPLATGWPELDGKTFIVANLVADTSFELQGSDTTGQAAPLVLAAGPLPAVTFDVLDEAFSLEQLCLSSIGINPETASPVSVGTFCDPTATVPGIEAGAGTLDLGFFLDKDSVGYAALLKAEADGNVHTFKIDFPNNGSLIMRGTVSGLNFTDIPMEGAVSLVANVTLASKPVHIF